jgi:hypothetical protein
LSRQQVAIGAGMPVAEQERRSGWPAGVLCGVLALAVCVASVAPSVEWQDSGYHQWRILTGRLEHPSGLALSHPVQFWLGRLALQVPLGEPAWRINMVSALFGAVAVGALAALIVRLTGNRLAACLAAAALMVAHSFWQMASTTEMYTIDATLMVFELLVLLEYLRRGRPAWFVLLFAINGLHVAHHLLGLLPLAVFGLLLLERLLRRKIAPGWVLACAGAWIVTTAPYWTMVLDYYSRTHNLSLTLRSAFFGGGEGHAGWQSAVMGLNVSTKQIKTALLSLGYNFPCFTLFLTLPGLFLAARGRLGQFGRVVLVQTLLTTAFVVRYRVPDVYTFFVPVDVLVALWFGLSIDWLWQRLRTLATRATFAVLLAVNALLPPLVYATFPVLVRQRHWLAGAWQHRPFRDEYAYWFQPWRHGDYSAVEFARSALKRVGPGGWFLGDSTTAATVAYWYLVHGGPPDAQVFSGRTCMTSDRPDLTDQEVRGFARAGGNVVVGASVVSDALWSPHFALDKRDPDWWRISIDP